MTSWLSSRTIATHLRFFMNVWVCTQLGRSILQVEFTFSIGKMLEKCQYKNALKIIYMHWKEVFIRYDESKNISG